MENLRVVILDCPYDTWSEPRTQQLFCDTAELRFSSYKSAYRDGILSMADSDFVSIHKLICEERNGRLVPLLGNSTITLERARHHRLPFPALGLVMSSDSVPHIKIMKDIMSRCDQQERRLGYDSGYAIANEVRPNREKAEHLHSIFGMMKVNFLKHYGIDESITAATVRFKVERFCKIFGYKAFEADGQRLADIKASRFDDELVTLLHMKQLEEQAIESAKKFKAMWDNRIVIERREYDLALNAA